MRTPERVLVIRAGALGDTLLALPAVGALRQAWPDSRVCWVGYPSYLEWLQGTPFVDSCRSIDSRLFCHMFDGKPEAQLAEFLSQFDYCIAWIRDPDKMVRHVLESSFGRHFLLAPPFPPEGSGVHASDHLMKTLHAAEDQRLSMAAAAAPLKKPPLIAQFDNNEDGKGASQPLRIMIHPGSGDRRKCWPLERFQEVAVNILGGSEAAVSWLLGPAEHEISDVLQPYCLKHGMELIRDLPLPRVAALIKRAGVFLGNDSGVTHLAAALGTQTWALFGPTRPEEWAPRGEHVHILRPFVHSDPRPEAFIHSPVKAGGLELISSERVSQSILAAIEKKIGGVHDGC